MNQTNKTNGLSLINLDSSVEILDSTKLKIDSFTDLESLLEKEFEGDGYVVSYLDYKLLIGTFTNGKLSFYNNASFEPKFIMKLRLFKKDCELYLWREANSLKGRMRKDIDNPKGKDKAVEANQLLWGTDIEDTEDANYKRIFEERGTEVILPFKNIEVDEERRIAIKTRSYISYENQSQASYSDSRFVMFVDNNGKKLGVENNG